MFILNTYIVVYLLPAAVAFCASHLLGRRISGHWSSVLVHAALLASIGAAQVTILASPHIFPWSASLVETATVLASLVAVGLLLGIIGVVYAASAFIQELTICSIVFLLASEISVHATALLVVPVFVACHPLSGSHRYTRLTVLSCWGTASILIFWLTHSIYVITALHIVFGGILIHTGILYPASRITTLYKRK